MSLENKIYVIFPQAASRGQYATNTLSYNTNIRRENIIADNDNPIGIHNTGFWSRAHIFSSSLWRNDLADDNPLKPNYTITGLDTSDQYSVPNEVDNRPNYYYSILRQEYSSSTWSHVRDSSSAQLEDYNRVYQLVQPGVFYTASGIVDDKLDAAFGPYDAARREYNGVGQAATVWRDNVTGSNSDEGGKLRIRRSFISFVDTLSKNVNFDTLQLNIGLWDYYEPEDIKPLSVQDTIYTASHAENARSASWANPSKFICVKAFDLNIQESGSINDNNYLDKSSGWVSSSAVKDTWDNIDTSIVYSEPFEISRSYCTTTNDTLKSGSGFVPYVIELNSTAKHNLQKNGKLDICIMEYNHDYLDNDFTSNGIGTGSDNIQHTLNMFWGRPFYANESGSFTSEKVFGKYWGPYLVGEGTTEGTMGSININSGTVRLTASGSSFFGAPRINFVAATLFDYFGAPIGSGYQYSASVVDGKTIYIPSEETPELVYGISASLDAQPGLVTYQGHGVLNSEGVPE